MDTFSQEQGDKRVDDGANPAKPSRRETLAAGLGAVTFGAILGRSLLQTGTPLEQGHQRSGIHNLLEFGADPTGVADSTKAISEWLAQGEGLLYAPSGVYRCAEVTAKVSGRTIFGDGQSQTVFKSSRKCARVLDFRESGDAVFHGFAVDGDHTARCGIDLATQAKGASQRNSLVRVRTLNCTDRGFDLSNNGDTCLTECHAGPFPDSATVCYWPNSGGNSQLISPTWFPAPAAPGPRRASLEASFQNLQILGGALMGVKILDNDVSQVMYASGVQFFAISNGGNIIGPSSGTGLMLLDLGGACKLATHTAEQSYFSGLFQGGIKIQSCLLNSGVRYGQSAAFASDFRVDSDRALNLEVSNSVLRHESDARPARWNDSGIRLNRSYRGFIGSPLPEYVDELHTGPNGLSVGNNDPAGVAQRTTVTTPSVSLGPGQTDSLLVEFHGANLGDLVLATLTHAIPDGVYLYATVVAVDRVRIGFQNHSPVNVTVPAGKCVVKIL